jgi:C4-dicarboxylate-specific signal transduction histidine kinase
MGAGRDLHGRRKDGSEVPVEIGLNPIDTPDGMAILASIIDITARRRIEAETAQQRSELTHLSRVAMLGELSGSLAHELNQPLTAILSNAQAAQRILGRGTGNLDEIREILKDIVEDDRRAGEVIKRLRTLFRKEEVRYRTLEVNDVVLDVLKLLRSDLLNRDVVVSAELAAGLPTVDGDPVQLQQVLLNLVMNGCDAMDGVPGDRRMTLRTAAAAGGEVEVSVADRGRGIPPGDLERIFEPFVSTKAEGMGLGLAVCRTIVAAHRGRLWAANNAARGASFHFTLPAGRDQPSERGGAPTV